MPETTQFHDEQIRYEFPFKRITLPATVGDKNLICYVSVYLLVERLGAQNESEGELKRVFDGRLPGIKEAAMRLINAGKVNEKGEVFLTTATWPS
jgi:hypothetical protein